MPRAPKTPPFPQPASTHREARRLRAPEAARPPAPAPVEARSDIEIGARVRVVAGPFSGKLGVVQGLDAKGGARVMLGLLAVRFELGNLTPQLETRARPVLGTSHRKPVSARS